MMTKPEESLAAPPETVQIFLQGDICLDFDIAITEPAKPSVPPSDFWFTQGEGLHNELLGGASHTRRVVEAVLGASKCRHNLVDGSVPKNLSVLLEKCETVEDYEKSKRDLVRSHRVVKKFKWSEKAKEKVWRIDDYLPPSRRERTPPWAPERLPDEITNVSVFAIEDQQLQFFGIPGDKHGERRAVGPFEFVADKWKAISSPPPCMLIKTTDLIDDGWQAFLRELPANGRDDQMSNATFFTPLSDLKKLVPGIHPGLSWDKTVGTILRKIRYPDGTGHEAAPRANYVIQLDLEGVLVIWDNQYALVYDPDCQPGDLSEFWDRSMSGGGSIIFATLIAAAAQGKLEDPAGLIRATELGLARARLLTAVGYLHPVKSDQVAKEFLEEDTRECPESPLDILACLTSGTEADGKTEWQTKEVREKLRQREHLVRAVDEMLAIAIRIRSTGSLPIPPKDELARGDWPGKSRFKIIDAAMQRKIDHAEADTAVEGRSQAVLDAALKLGMNVVCKGDSALKEDGFPIEKIGKFVSVDPEEIENVRVLRQLFRNYQQAKEETKRRPLCVAVFGAPGSGKGFIVRQMTKDLLGDDILEYNLSQITGRGELVAALHTIRDHVLQGKLPVVFWDEFDTAADGRSLGWIPQFLSPMQDGSFVEEGVVHPIGSAVFVFGGGAAHSYERFVNRVRASRRAGQGESDVEKGSDFVSRLRGFLDIKPIDLHDGKRLLPFAAGPSKLDRKEMWVTLVRRAFLIRSLLLRHAPKLQTISKAVLQWLLRADYEHGTRSVEAIIEMSALAGRAIFDPNCFPPRRMYRMHMDWKIMEALRKATDASDKPPAFFEFTRDE